MRNMKILTYVNALLFLGVIVVNALANIVPINNYNTGELSDMIPNLFVPAGVTFAIWGVIYILLALLVIFNIIESHKNPTKTLYMINILLGLNFILNSCWILTWHYRLITLSVFVMLGIFATLFLLDRKGVKVDYGTFKKIYALTIGVYFGWISVALIANITALLVTIGWNGYPLTDVTWTIVMIIIGALIAVAMQINSKNSAYALVFIWAFAGIIIKRSSSIPVYNSIIGASVVGIVLILVSLFIPVSKRKES